MKSKHKRTEELFLQELRDLKKMRYEALDEYIAIHGIEDGVDVDGIIAVMRIADQLTQIVEDVLKIDHPLATQVAGVLAATIHGITSGDVENEIENFLALVEIRRAMMEEKTSETKH